ncbi:MAG: aminotransferase class I/II-fold pyridoxal phosphate-dependent enzyme [Terriglobia bacterium]
MRAKTSRVSRRQLMKFGATGLALGTPYPAIASAWPSTGFLPQETTQPHPSAVPVELVKIDGNENPYGPSQMAMQAIRDAISRSNRYVLSADKLQRAIALHHQVGLGMIQVGYGSSEILKMAAEAFLGPGKKLIVASPTYEGMARVSEVQGATVVRVPLDSQFRHDLRKMQEAVTEDTGLIYICNPNNPTATYVTADALGQFVNQLPPRIPIVVDEAYFHYVEDPAYRTALESVMNNKPVIVTRTFSKIYGMAGLRLGYAVAREDLIAKMAAHRVWLNSNALTLAAGLACFEDQAFISWNRSQNRGARDYVVGELRKMGYETIPSQVNFFMIDLKRNMQPVQAALRDRQVMVGRPFNPLTNHLRVTVGTRPEMERFLVEFKQVMG